MTMTIAAGTASTFTANTAMTGFEIRNIPGCNIVDHRNGNGTAPLTLGASISGTIPVKIDNINGTLDFPFTATISGKTMNGTWTCPNCTGTFTLTKQ
jgi:hypothetical protein